MTCCLAIFLFLCSSIHLSVNPCPAEPWYALPLQTVKIQISWLLKKPTDLDLHYLPFCIWILYQQPGSSNLIGWKWEVGEAEHEKSAWHLNLFSMTRINALLKILHQCFLSPWIDTFILHWYKDLMDVSPAFPPHLGTLGKGHGNFWWCQPGLYLIPWPPHRF